jgi:hypothetical protein
MALTGIAAFTALSHFKAATMSDLVRNKQNVAVF